jgi:hypothetical protein
VVALLVGLVEAPDVGGGSKVVGREQKGRPEAVLEGLPVCFIVLLKVERERVCQHPD